MDYTYNMYNKPYNRRTLFSIKPLYSNAKDRQSKRMMYIRRKNTVLNGNQEHKSDLIVVMITGIIICLTMSKMY